MEVLQAPAMGIGMLFLPEEKKIPRRSKLSTIALLAESTNSPFKSETVLSNLPFVSTGIIIGRLYFNPVQ